MRRAWVWAGSALWSTASQAARVAARWGLPRAEKLPGRVVSVGNIQAGGAGKTPVVAALAREAASRGLRVCILTRGYRGRAERRGATIPPGAPADPRECGDEAALLRELAPDAFIAVGADRVAQYRRAETEAGGGFDLVLLDDGFQHRRIARDLDIVLVTSRGRGEILHREWACALRQADLVVWTKGELEPRLGSRAPDARVRFEIDPPAGSSADVWLVSGVADPAGVARSARDAGFRVRRHVAFEDHAEYSAEQARRLIREAAADSSRVALTGKDWVKWKALGIGRDQVEVIEPRAVFDWGKDRWDRVLWGSSA